MKTKLSPIQILGLCLMPVSMIIYHYVPNSNGSLEGAALLNYPIAIIYMLISLADRPNNKSLFKAGIPKLNWHIFLSLMMISCFTLNKDIHVFASTPLWLQAILPVSLSTFILLSYPTQLPLWLKKLSSFILGIGILIFLYYTIALLPYTPLAFIGLVLLGISIHLIIPLLILLSSLITAFKTKFINAIPGFTLAGFACGAIFLIIYISLYVHYDHKIKSTQQELVLNENDSLPEWVRYAQNSNSAFWTKRIIGKNLIYETYNNDWFSLDFNRGSFSEIRQHDPLVATASLFTDEISLSNQEQVQILSACADTRHYSYEKLWSGRHLSINKEVTDVRIYPEFRLAYFEKTFWIENYSTSRWSQEEALFTFYLPEGAVASSLSLWIDGKEETSRLTTRKKAAKAYKTIVGHERRDPVVLHWQEGNRLTATIFPCTPKEARRVKIGITTPLLKQGNQLCFTNMKYDGPKNINATETIHVKIIGNTDSYNPPSFFEEKLPKQFIYEGHLKGHWQFEVKTNTISNTTFSFNQKHYRLKPIESTKLDTPQAIYLDINQSWSKDELISILSHADQTPVYIHLNDFKQLDLTNLDTFYEYLSDKTFSLFPIFELPSTNNILLITKGSDQSPIPSELKNSPFYDNLIKKMNDNTQSIPTLVLGENKSPYITALEQFKLLNCRNTTIANLTQQPIDAWFQQYKSSDNKVNIPMAGITIEQVETNAPNSSLKAPSHLLRLYNYHKVMQSAGHLFLKDEADIPDSIYNLCNEAYIVTPISSLIVLETQKDYERFDIKENKNSLKNANLQDSGAVPEPHEWALIITLSLIVFYFYIKFR